MDNLGPATKEDMQRLRELSQTGQSKKRSMEKAQCQRAQELLDFAKGKSAVAAEREAIANEFSDRMQADLENGVKWLNELEAKEFAKKYPLISSFGDWLHTRERK